MTPVLSAVYDEMLARASASPLSERALALRDAFLRRTSSSSRTAAEPEDRLRAAWDDALTNGGLARELAEGFDDPSERALARVLSRAHRAIFRMTVVGLHHIARDVISGASFLVLARDDIAREVLALGVADCPLFEARLVAATDGCAMLPGIIFHPPDATELIADLIRIGAERRISRDDLCDALLRMQHTFRTLSRVKIGYAYKSEALGPAALPDAARAGG